MLPGVSKELFIKIELSLQSQNTAGARAQNCSSGSAVVIW